MDTSRAAWMGSLSCGAALSLLELADALVLTRQGLVGGSGYPQTAQCNDRSRKSHKLPRDDAVQSLYVRIDSVRQLEDGLGCPN